MNPEPDQLLLQLLRLLRGWIKIFIQLVRYVYKIYFNDKPLFLCDDIDETIQPFIHHDDTVFIDELNTHAIKTMIHEMQLPNVHAGVYFHTDLDELKKLSGKNLP